MSPRVSPPRNPAALAVVLLANQAVAGSRTVPPRPRCFIKVRRPSCPLEFAGVSGFAKPMSSCVERSLIGLFCISHLRFGLILAFSLCNVPDRPITQNIPPSPEISCWGSHSEQELVLGGA